LVDVQLDGKPHRRKPAGLLVRLALSPRFHALVERIPLLRGRAHAEGRALFSILSGFVQSQVLMALVELQVLHRLAEGPQDRGRLARLCDVPEARMQVLLQAGAGLGLLRHRAGTWRLTTRGAAFLAVPGLEAMVRHHSVLYRDLEDPAAFFRGQTTPELAGFWPYVFGPLGQADANVAARYSDLMADSQSLVAQDTLRLINLSDRKRLLDVGGGTGAFLAAVAVAYPSLGLTLFDLPQVVQGAEGRFPALAGRLIVRPGSFRSDPLPADADAISLVRVLYDHSDSVVEPLLAAVHAALPQGGRVIVSEPMSGGARPDAATDVYFAVYTMAMQTGQTRSAARISELLANAGFSQIRPHPGARPYVTSVVEARKL